MSDNVVKFRPPPKKPEPGRPQKQPGLPGWVPWVGLIVLALAIYGVQRGGLLGG